jgi:hypothetical protein
LFESACKGTLPSLVIVQIKNDHLIAEFGAMRSAAQKVSVFGPSPKKKAPCTSTYEIDVGERIFQQLVCSDTDRSPIIVRVRPKAGMRSLGVPLDNVLSHCLRLHGEVPERSNGAVSKFSGGRVAAYHSILKRLVA